MRQTTRQLWCYAVDSAVRLTLFLMRIMRFGGVTNFKLNDPALSSPFEEGGLSSLKVILDQLITDEISSAHLKSRAPSAGSGTLSSRQDCYFYLIMY